MDVRTVSKSDRHFASDIRDVGTAVPHFASALASTKNRISNNPSWPKKRTAFRASSRLREGLGKANVTMVLLQTSLLTEFRYD